MLGYDEKNESIEVAKQFTAYQKPQERWIPLDADEFKESSVMLNRKNA